MVGRRSCAETYYFIGKDNIFYHTIFWPAVLMAYGGLNLPTDVPANQYVTFKGEKASKSEGVGNRCSRTWSATNRTPSGTASPRTCRRRRTRISPRRSCSGATTTNSSRPGATLSTARWR